MILEFPLQFLNSRCCWKETPSPPVTNRNLDLLPTLHLEDQWALSSCMFSMCNSSVCICYKCARFIQHTLNLTAYTRQSCLVNDCADFKDMRVKKRWFPLVVGSISERSVHTTLQLCRVASLELHTHVMTQHCEVLQEVIFILTWFLVMLQWLASEI